MSDLSKPEMMLILRLRDKKKNPEIAEILGVKSTAVAPTISRFKKNAPDEYQRFVNKYSNNVNNSNTNNVNKSDVNKSDVNKNQGEMLTSNSTNIPTPPKIIPPKEILTECDHKLHFLIFENFKAFLRANIELPFAETVLLRIQGENKRDRSVVVATLNLVRIAIKEGVEN